MNQMFEVSTATLMPLILKMKEENEYIKEQKDHLQVEMECLEALSKNVLMENQQMRDHYFERNNDLQKLIRTMTLNTEENIQDSNHLVHAYRESNHIITRNIDLLTQQIDSIQAEVSKAAGELARTQAENMHLDSKLRSKNLKKRELKTKMDELQRVQDKIDLEGL